MNRKMNDRYMLRLPDGWREKLKTVAARNRRSMNQEILGALEPLIAQKENGPALERQTVENQSA
jgi:plasmid stability protein